MGFSERLRELREKKGLSQEGLAKELNIPRSTITNYENDDSRLPRQSRINEIADFFGVTVDYLIGRTTTSELTSTEEDFMENMDHLSLEEIIQKYHPKLDGKPVTKEELPVLLAVIRSLRGPK